MLHRTARVQAMMLALWMICASATALAAEPPATAPTFTDEHPLETRTGQFDAQYPLLPDEQSKRLVMLACARQSHLQVQGFTRAALWAKFGGQAVGDGHDDPPDYQVYVPRDYAPGKLFGLLVWNSAGPRGDIPGQFKAVCDRLHLIWLAPAQVGNDRQGAWRVYMALEAAAQARRRFTIDSQRIYAAGGSGGGRVTSRVAIHFADTFTGVVCIIGCDSYKKLQVAGDPSTYWNGSGFWPRPDPALLARAKNDNRFVILEGSRDMNLNSAKDLYAAYALDGFKRLAYLEVPAMGHTMPPAEWFLGSIAFLDKPLAATAELLERAKAAEQRGRLGEACLAYGRAALRDTSSVRSRESQAKADVIYAEFVEQVAVLRAQFGGDVSKKFVADIATLRTRFGPMLVDLAPDVEEKSRALNSSK